MEKAGGGGLKRPWSGKHLELLLRELAKSSHPLLSFCVFTSSKLVALF